MPCRYSIWTAKRVQNQNVVGIKTFRLPRRLVRCRTGIKCAFYNRGCLHMRIRMLVDMLRMRERVESFVLTRLTYRQLGGGGYVWQVVCSKRLHFDKFQNYFSWHNTVQFLYQEVIHLMYCNLSAVQKNIKYEVLKAWYFVLKTFLIHIGISMFTVYHRHIE